MYPTSKMQERKSLIAVLLPEINDRYTTSILKGIEDVFQENDLKIMLNSTWESPEQEKRLLQEAVDWEVGGVIVYPAQGEHYNDDILRLALNQFPIVVIDRHVRGIEMNCVHSDHESGAYKAVQRLIELGHAQIGFLSTRVSGITSLEERLSGYERALSEAAIAVDRSLRLEDADEPAIEAFLHQHSSLSAIIASHYTIGLKALNVCRKLGVSVPEQLSIIVFDDYDYSEYSRLPFTYVKQQEVEIGRHAARMLIELMERPKERPERMILPVSLVERASTAERLSK